MENPEHKKGQPLFGVIEIGDPASRASSVVFFLLCLILVFSTIVFGAVDQGTWVIIILITFAVTAAWFMDAWFGRGLLINRDVLLVPLLCLILIGLLQILPIFSSSIPPGLIENSYRGTISLEPYSTRLFVVRLMVYAVFLAAALTFLNHERRLRKIVVLIIVFGSLLAFYGILQRLANPEGIYGLRGTPQAIPFGPFVNQHHFAAFMVMTSGMTFAFLFGNAVQRDKRLLLAIAAVVMGIATVMTSSRGGILSFVGTLIFVVAASSLTRPVNGHTGPATGHGPKIAAIAGAIALILVIIGTVLFLGADSTLIRGIGLSETNDISSGRSHFWPIAFKVFLDHPLFGAGLDAFGTAFTKYDSWPGVFRVEQAHNDYLQALADAGIAGFACLASYVYFLFRKGLAAITSSGDGFRRSAAIGAIAGCFGILIHSFFDFPLRTPSNAFFFLMLSAIAVIRFKQKRHQ